MMGGNGDINRFDNGKTVTGGGYDPEEGAIVANLSLGVGPRVILSARCVLLGVEDHSTCVIQVTGSAVSDATITISAGEDEIFIGDIETWNQGGTVR